MKKRAYVSSVRSAAAAEKRDRVIEAAAKLLREDASIARFSLDTVARAAGVTRLTVYNQFGSRGRLLEAMATDPEFAEALLERNERRRKLVRMLVGRVAAKTASRRAREDAVDMIFALTSYPMFAMLNRGRPTSEVCRLAQTACRAAVSPLSR